jgi:hypothetical protein
VEDNQHRSFVISAEDIESCVFPVRCPWWKSGVHGWSRCKGGHDEVDREVSRIICTVGRESFPLVRYGDIVGSDGGEKGLKMSIEKKWIQATWRGDFLAEVQYRLP